jgi:hypothetical protein
MIDKVTAFLYKESCCERRLKIKAINGESIPIHPWPEKLMEDRPAVLRKTMAFVLWGLGVANRKTLSDLRRKAARHFDGLL